MCGGDGSNLSIRHADRMARGARATRIANTRAAVASKTSVRRSPNKAMTSLIRACSRDLRAPIGSRSMPRRSSARFTVVRYSVPELR